MIDLSIKPFYFDENKIKYIENILEKMSLEEKIGQLFCPIGTTTEKKELKEFIQKYKPGGMMFRPLEKHVIKDTYRFIQEESCYPLLLAANIESGGIGICQDGTYFSRQMAIAATGNKKHAYLLGQICGKEANAVYCNWSFAPILDIDFNYMNPITNVRTYGSHINTIIECASEQIKGLRENRVIPCIKHFPGDGVDFRDQHLLSSVNSLSKEKWDESYGKIYQKFIDDGVETLMVGHILLPEYTRFFHPYINDSDILPASLSKEVLTDLLRNTLGFNGLVVTDATPMLGYNVALPRSQSIPLSIENGCDMILFNKNIDEDYQFMRDGIRDGVLSIERVNEAVTRILAVKMKAGLFEKIIPLYNLEIVGCQLHHDLAYQCAKDSITLVKEECDVLPLSVDKYKKIRLIQVGDNDNGGFKEIGCQSHIKDFLEKEGFEIEEFDQENLDMYEVFEAGVDFIKSKSDLVIYIANFDTASNNTTRRLHWIEFMAANGPWFINEVPTIFISMSNPYHLVDVPMIKTFINCYNPTEEVYTSLINKLMGREEFVGHSPIDPFCGLWDTRR